MALHVVVHHSRQQIWPVVNVDEESLQQRFIGPWLRGEPIVARGQHFNAGDYWLSVYEGAERSLHPDPIRLVIDIQSSDRDATDDYVTVPFGSGRPKRAEDVTFAVDRRKVMVVHGRNERIRVGMFEFLRALDLRPLEWVELVGSVSSGAPYVGEVLDSAFSQAQAVVVLFTPDDVARLQPALSPAVDERESTWRGQARPNVFFDAGMAIGRFPQRTILTEVGELHPASDLAGRHTVRLAQDPDCRKDLANRLKRRGTSRSAQTRIRFTFHPSS